MGFVTLDKIKKDLKLQKAFKKEYGVDVFRKMKLGDMVRSKTGRGRPTFKVVAHNKYGYDISDGFTEFGTFSPAEMEKKFTSFKPKRKKKK